MSKFYAMFNMPGCMPDSDPYLCDTFDEAKRCVIEDLKNAEDSALNETDAEDFCHMAEEVNLETGPFCTPTMPDGYRYSVQEG